MLRFHYILRLNESIHAVPLSFPANLISRYYKLSHAYDFPPAIGKPFAVTTLWNNNYTLTPMPAPGTTKDENSMLDLFSYKLAVSFFHFILRNKEAAHERC
jgi:hypothetical protein